MCCVVIYDANNHGALAKSWLHSILVSVGVRERNLKTGSWHGAGYGRLGKEVYRQHQAMI